jgi:hypothetical protein
MYLSHLQIEVFRGGSYLPYDNGRCTVGTLHRSRLLYLYDLCARACTHVNISAQACIVSELKDSAEHLYILVHRFDVAYLTYTRR